MDKVDRIQMLSAPIATILEIHPATPIENHQVVNHREALEPLVMFPVVHAQTAFLANSEAAVAPEHVAGEMTVETEDLDSDVT